MFGFGGFFGHTFGEVYREYGTVVSPDDSVLSLFSDEVEIVRTIVISIDSATHEITSSDVAVVALKWRDSGTPQPIDWGFDTVLPQPWDIAPEAPIAPWGADAKEAVEWEDRADLIPQPWQPTDPALEQDWSGQETQPQGWDQTEKSDTAEWGEANNSQSQQWSESNNAQPSHWRQ